RLALLDAKAMAFGVPRRAVSTAGRRAQHDRYASLSVGDQQFRAPVAIHRSNFLAGEPEGSCDFAAAVAFGYAARPAALQCEHAYFHDPVGCVNLARQTAFDR